MQAEILQKLSEILVDLPFNRLLGLRLDEITEKQITMSFSMKEELIGNYLHGILHGGVTSSVLDMAGGVAVMVAALKKHPNESFEKLATMLGRASTVNLHIDYIRPGKGETFIAKASLIHAGNKISFARMELFNQDDILIANATGTYLFS
jgi:uncharacterized protein (TIGR00369 family)